MAKNVELLLTESVESLGIVGDVVRVRTGYARNYLLPNNMATTPTQEKIQALAAKRADAEQHQRELRSQREALVKRVEGAEITLKRSCNDQGQLYGSVTQQDIAEALNAVGFGIKARDVRLAQVIKRVDNYHVPLKLDSDLEADITLHVVADRDLNVDEREEMDFDNEGNLIEKPKGPKRPRREEAEAPAGDGEQDKQAHAEKKGDRKGGDKKGGHAKEEAKAPASEPADKPGTFSKRVERKPEVVEERKSRKRRE